MTDLLTYQKEDHQKWGPLFVEALKIALEFQGDQKDFESEAPYIFHLMRVSHRCKSYPAKITAILHDVVEDSDCTLTTLDERGMPAIIVSAVNLLTHDNDIDYYDYVRGIRSEILKSGGKDKAASVAREVKLSDLMDNMHIRRDGLALYNERCMKRIARYRKAWRILMELED
jgi:(p)ppGpp synthase/HD superfamily hydrolase